MIYDLIENLRQYLKQIFVHVSFAFVGKSSKGVPLL